MPTSLPLTTRAPASAQPPKPIRWLALAHFANDFFSGSLGILLAAQANQLGLSNAQIGNAAGLFLLLSLSQPFLGWIADRTGRTDVMLTGPFWTALGLLICGLAESYLVVLMGVLVGGMGNAMFHPSALANARAFGGLRGKGRSVALFMLGGNGGFGVGPFLAGFLLDAMGPPGIAPYALVSFVLVPLLVWRLLPYSRDRLADIQTETASDAAPSAGPQIAPRWRTVIGLLGAYLVIVLVRGIPNQGFSTFMPTFYSDQGYGLGFAGLATSILLVSSAVGSFIGASLSDRMSRLMIASFSLFMIAPLSFLLLNAEGILPIVVLSILLGLMLNANWPILLMIGQEVFPGGAGASSGLAFGWGFVANALGSFIAGFLADAIGLREALELLALLPVIGAGLIFLMPSGR